MPVIKLKHLLFLLIVSLCFNDSLEAQLNVSPNKTAQELVQRLVGDNVVVLNPTLSCNGDQNGTFVSSSTNLGLAGGIILATGAASTLSGPHGNSVEASSGGDNQDADLSHLIGDKETHSACILEFDFVPDVDSQATLRFNYVFGSEEYTSFTCSPYNDVFGFLISGPGYNPKVNVALVPGTSIPVAINSVNSGVPSSGYNITPCQSMGPGSPFPQYYVNNVAQNGQTITLEGFTTVLEASAVIYPCDTYHMKLGIANVADGAYQSAVFLQENSFTVDTVKLDLSGIITSDYDYLVEGCTPATIKATRTQPSPYRKKICLSYGGSAVNGLDYPMLPDTLIIEPNATLATMVLDPIQDNMDEPGFETVIIRRLNCCTKEPIDSIEIRVRDSLRMELLSKDTAICGREVVQLRAIGDKDFNYSWTPTTDVTNPQDTFTTAFPAVPVTYTITATFMGCPPVSRSFFVNVEPIPIVTISPHDTAFCLSAPYELNVDVQPDTFTDYSFHWSPGDFLDDPDSQHPKFYSDVAQDFNYVLTVQTPLECTGKDSIHLITRPAVTLTDVTADFVAKYGTTVPLNAAGTYVDYFTWTPARLLDYPNTHNPTASALDTATFQVIGTSRWGCRDTAYVRMDIDYSMFEIIPNAFSPNGDNINDVFRIGNMKYQRLLEFRIFNRWGQEVFSTIDPQTGWDGTFKGAPQGNGTYHYLIRIATPEGKQKVYNGDVSLLR